MSDNMKTFLEAISKDQELIKKLSTITDKADIIAMANSLGIELSESDFKSPDGEISEKELLSVSGGDCICALAGGGGGKDKYDGKTYGCACVGYGQGGDGSADDFNCCCVLEGGGVDGHILEGDGFSFM